MDVMMKITEYITRLRQEKTKQADDQIQKFLMSKHYHELCKKDTVMRAEEHRKKLEQEKIMKDMLQHLILTNSPRLTFLDLVLGDVPYYQIFRSVAVDGQYIESYLVCNICKKPIRKVDHRVTAIKQHWRMHLRKGDCSISDEGREEMTKKSEQHKEKLRQQKTETVELQYLILKESPRIKICDMGRCVSYRQFYSQVYLDGENMKNYRVCKICKKPIRQLGDNIAGLGQHRNVHMKRGDCTLDGLKEDESKTKAIEKDTQLSQPSGIDYSN